MSIGIVTPSFYPMIGGIESYVKNISAELVKLRFEVHIYTPDSVLGKRISPREEELDGFHIHRLPVAFDLSYRIKFWPSLLNALQKRRHDILHVYSHDSYALLSSLAAKKRSAKTILTTYGPFVNHSDYGLAKSILLNLYDEMVTPSLFNRADLIFVRYPELFKWVGSYGVPKERIELEPSGIPLSYIEHADGSEKREQINPNGKIILYLGRLSPHKGLEYLLRSYKIVSLALPDTKLVLVGPDYSGYLATLKRISRSLGMEEKVLFLPPVTDEDEEKKLLSSCDIFVMPSSFEGFSQAVMKAMAQGKPVVASAVGGLPYEIEYGRCGILVNFGDQFSLAAAQLKLLKDEKLRAELGANALVRAKNFTFDRLSYQIAKKYIGLTN